MLHPGGEVGPGDLSLLPMPTAEPDSQGQVLRLAEYERNYILRVYRQNDMNKTTTASRLGINRLNLRRKLKDFGIE